MSSVLGELAGESHRARRSQGRGGNDAARSCCRARPTSGPGGAVGICGSDRSAFQRHHATMVPPFVLDHEFAGGRFRLGCPPRASVMRPRAHDDPVRCLRSEPALHELAEMIPPDERHEQSGRTREKTPAESADLLARPGNQSGDHVFLHEGVEDDEGNDGQDCECRLDRVVGNTLNALQLVELKWQRPVSW